MSTQRDIQKYQAAITAYMICRQSGETVQYEHRNGVSGFSGYSNGHSGFSGFSGRAYFPAVQSDYQKIEDDNSELTKVKWTIPYCSPPLHGCNFPPNTGNEPTIGDYIIHDNHRYRVMAASKDPLGACWDMETEREQKRRSK